MIPDPVFTEVEIDGFECEKCQSHDLRCEIADATRGDEVEHARFMCRSCRHVYWITVEGVMESK